MTIQQQLSLRFTAITGGLLIAFSVVVYFSAYQNRESEFYKNLEKEAFTKLNLLYDAQIDSLSLQTIYRKNREILNEVEVAIYDTDFRLMYHDAVDIDFVKESDEMLSEILENGELRFYQDDWQVLGLRMELNGNTFLVTAAAYDEYGYTKLYQLRNSLIVSYLFALLIIYFSGKYFSKKALRPVAKITAEAQKISATNLDLRVRVREGNDELNELANTFNAMLERLEQSFDSQKSFVSNIAHEVRTPLSAIIAELSWALEKERQPDDYKTSISEALTDARKINRLTAALLDLAKASYDPALISFSSTRVDEVLMDARADVLKIEEGYQVSLQIADFNEKHLKISANAYLLRSAFANIIENACKYSGNHQCEIELKKEKTQLKIIFHDQGEGISEGEIKKIFEPFYRAEGNMKKGSGIGLSLAKRIIDLHRGEIEIESIVGKGSTVSILLPIA